MSTSSSRLVKDTGLLVALYTLELINNIDPSHLKPDPFQGVPHGWESEDCLLLDVVVPEGVAEAVKEDDDFVPLSVIVWIHGGGFAFGHKNQDGSPYSFFNASKFTPDSVAIRDKGILFTDIKSVENDDTFAAFIRNSLPGLKDEDVEYIVKYLYPLEEENTGVLHKLLRGANATAELSTICNAVYLLDAFGDEGSYKYVFGVEPGVHGQDVGFSVSRFVLDVLSSFSKILTIYMVLSKTTLRSNRYIQHGKISPIN
ncbi:carboxylesterase family protein [Botrytis cinerea]